MAVLLLLLVAARGAAPEDRGRGSDVVVLDDDSFERRTQGSTDADWFVKFYASWCGHCKMLAPVWEVLATEVKGSSVNVAHVNCDEGGSSTCTRFGVQTLPTLLYFTGDNYHEYKGLRTPQILIRYALETRKFDDRDLSVVPPKEPDTISTLVADVDWIYVACWLFLIGLFFWAVCDCCGGGGGHDGGDGDGDGGSRAGADGADETKGTKETRGGSSPAPHVSPERAVRQRGRKTKASSE